MILCRYLVWPRFPSSTPALLLLLVAVRLCLLSCEHTAQPQARTEQNKFASLHANRCKPTTQDLGSTRPRRPFYPVLPDHLRLAVSAARAAHQRPLTVILPLHQRPSTAILPPPTKSLHVRQGSTLQVLGMQETSHCGQMTSLTNRQTQQRRRMSLGRDVFHVLLALDAQNNWTGAAYWKRQHRLLARRTRRHRACGWVL